MIADNSPEFARYSKAVQSRRDSQTARDALGGYVDSDHPDHPDRWSRRRRAAVLAADAALALTVIELNLAVAAHAAMSLDR